MVDHESPHTQSLCQPRIAVCAEKPEGSHTLLAQSGHCGNLLPGNALHTETLLGKFSSQRSVKSVTTIAAGKIYIHAVSALSIRNVAIKPGNYGQAVAIEVDMSGEAGIFRVPAEMLRRTSA